MECDIRDLSQMFGLPGRFEIEEKAAKWHGFGIVPVGDAFLAWGWSTKRGPAPLGLTSTPDSRWQFHAITAAVVALLLAQYILLTRRTLRKLRQTYLTNPQSPAEAIQ
ncbi:MAG: hypothetical protein K1X53_05865 [Candidatus Sumerlaeaceae bacterium]|nr:hypothetical protein [Candidatus Sumerlaeaceae bacterium]